MKFEKLWLFERSEFQRFSNFIIAQCMAEIRSKPLLLDIEFWAHNTNLLVDQMIYDIFINYYMNNFTVLSVVGVL